VGVLLLLVMFDAACQRGSESLKGGGAVSNSGWRDSLDLANGEQRRKERERGGVCKFQWRAVSKFSKRGERESGKRERCRAGV
jgi:hypothetical protein